MLPHLARHFVIDRGPRRYGRPQLLLLRGLAHLLDEDIPHGSGPGAFEQLFRPRQRVERKITRDHCKLEFGNRAAGGKRRHHAIAQPLRPGEFLIAKGKDLLVEKALLRQ